MTSPPDESAPPAGAERGESSQDCQDPNTTPERAQDHAARAECVRIIRALVGDMRPFLNSPQPALGDRTGRELLADDPLELLRRLRALEGGAG